MGDTAQRALFALDLRIDEAKKLRALCHELAAAGEDGPPHMVAAALGHVSPTTTLTSYALSGSVQHAQQIRALEVLGSSSTTAAPAPN